METIKAEDKEILDRILKEHGYSKDQVIAVLQGVQHHYHYLPEEALLYVAHGLKLNEARVYGVATFYENFSLEPKGKYVIKVCDGTACHVRNSTPVLKAFREAVGLRDGQNTTEDMLFTVETVSCLGACGLAPACTVNDVVHPTMTPEKVRALVAELREEIQHDGTDQ